MASLIWESRPEDLRAPAVICAFTGWNDAGDAASAALRFFGASLEAERFAHIDPEEFYDFQENRPQVLMTEGRTRKITWPTVEVYAARVPGAQRDLVLLSGPEPNFRWRTFAHVIAELAESLEAQLVVTLGSLLADIPHSRPVAITGGASDDALARRLDLRQTEYEGSTGITGVVNATCDEYDIPAVSMWASVPHYVAAAPNPKAALALIRKLETLVGVSVDAAELEDATIDYEQQIALAIQSDSDVQEFVERLERAAEEEDEAEQENPVRHPTELPDGDVIARDFQRFLRQRDN